MMTLYLTRKAGTEPIPLSLPATPADIGNAFAELDAICPNPSATEIYKVDSEIRNLNRYIERSLIPCQIIYRFFKR